MNKKVFSLFLCVIGMCAASFTAASTYCSPSTTYGTLDGDFIARVLLTGSTNVLDSSGVNAPRPDYFIYNTGANVPILLTGQTYSITLQVGYFANRNAIAAWIDFNGDGTFDTWEKLGETDNMNPNTLTTFSFTVPGTGVTTATRLRVRERFDANNGITSGPIDPCVRDGQPGEIEDYDINDHFPIVLVGGSTRRVIPTDDCPNGDSSPTPYDGLCSGMSASNGTLAGVSSSSVTGTTVTGNIASTGILIVTGSTQLENTGIVVNPTSRIDADICADTEMENAYLYAHEHGITSMDTCKKANMDGLLLRKAAAKMIANFAVNVLGKKIDLRKKCVFTDLTGETLEAQGYEISACQLGIMGLKGDGTPASTFNPGLPLDKVQFVVMLSRLLYGELNNSSDACRYCKHVDALYDANVIMTKTGLFSPFIRGRAMLMLKRIDQ